MPQNISAQIKSESWQAGFLPLKPVRFSAKDWDTPKSLGALGNFSQWILKWKWHLLRTPSQVQIEWKSTDIKDTELWIYMYIRKCLIALLFSSGQVLFASWNKAQSMPCAKT